MIVWALLLYFIGLALVLSEFFLPGMIAGAVGGCFIVGSCAMGIYGNPASAIFVIPLEIGGLVVTVGLGMYLMSRTRMGKGLILNSNQDPNAGYVAFASETALIGVEGTVHTALRPAGTIIIDGRRIDAVSDGSFIEENARIRVIQVHGSRVVVERLA